MVVVKGLVNSSKHPYSYFKHCKAFCLGLFFGYFLCFYGENVDKEKFIAPKPNGNACYAGYYGPG